MNVAKRIRALGLGTAVAAMVAGMGPGLTPVASAQARGEGSISGRVGDTTGSAFFGDAEVRIVELNRTVTTRDDGRFVFTGVPAGDYTLRVTYVGAPAETVEVSVAPGQRAEVTVAIGADVASDANILVVGTRANLSSAINDKRTSTRVQDGVSADFIGQFPDQNVTEAAQRIPGVAINRDQGEGRFISVRGISPNLNAVTVNGIDLPSAEGDQRQVALDVIPSDVLSKLTVVKSLTPDLDANSIGGTVQIESATAFDRSGFYATASAEGNYNQLRDEVSPRLSAAASNVFDTGMGEIGIYGAISYFDRQLGSDGIENGDGEVDSIDGSLFPVSAEPRDYVLSRERLGATLNIDWRVNDDVSFYVRQLYSRFTDDERQSGTIVELDPDDGDNIVEAGPTRLLLANQEVESYASQRKETQTIYSVAFGGHNRAGDLTVDYQIDYSQAGEDNPDYAEAIFVADFSDSDTLIGTDLADARRPRIITSGPGFADPTAYELDEVIREDSRTLDQRYSARIDFTLDGVFGDLPGAIKTGAKIALRERMTNLDARIYGGADQGATVADFLNPDIDYPLGLIAPQNDPRAVADFIRANQAAFDDDLDEEGSFIDSNAEDYRVREDIYAGYAMATLDIGDLRLVGGVRVEHTEYNARGNEVSLDEEAGTLALSPITINDSYTDVLPSLNARWRAAERLQLRAAYFRSVVRPIYEQNRPAALFERDDEGVIEAQAGNPDLERFKADNFDLGVEYFPSGSSVISAGAFYKRLQNPTFGIDLAGTDGFEGFDVYDTFINGESADILGFEANIQQDLTFLPSPLDGLLIAANYTFTDADARVPLPNGTTRDAVLPFQARHTANASIGYDKYGFQFRAALTYRDRILDEIGDPTDPAGDVFIDEHLQIDLTAAYQVTPGVRVFGQVTNLNDRPLYSYAGRRDVNVQFEEYGLSASLGLRVTFGK
ncbi:TonB-dependent receptor [Sphingomonas sp.]|uniref:TonB-dependent receptor n=1 Tax=Sphingomonas sp. TaxID=28214 RepID=UPI002D0BDFB9|nr:TonB-dependent receptor [Sphingomonas sp.]HTG38016.1 TonB-dependent receptor [Sphingomonas sp.]